MSAECSVDLETMQSTIRAAIAQNNGPRDVAAVLRIIGRDVSFFPSLVRKITNMLGEYRKVVGKDSSVARNDLSKACFELNKCPHNLGAISNLLHRVLLNSAPDEVYMPSAYRLRAVVIAQHAKDKDNLYESVEFADMLDRSDETLVKDFGLGERALANFNAILSQVRGYGPSAPSLDDESLYVSLSIKLRESAERGQHYVAQTNIDAEEVIFREKLFAAAVHPERVLFVCGGCYTSRSLPMLFPCDKCRHAAFCTLPCKAKACEPGGVHARQCGTKLVFAEFCPPEDVKYAMLVYNVLSRFDPDIFVSGELNRMAPCTAAQHLINQRHPVFFKEAEVRRQKGLASYILSMATFKGYVNENDFVDNLTASIGAALLWLIQHKKADTFNAKRTQQLINICYGQMLRVGVNTFALANNDRESAGPCLVLFGSRFNHACSSNATWTTKNGLFTFTAIKPIAPGEEVTVNYIGRQTFADNFEARQLTLFNAYDFLCDCSACKVDLFSGDRALLACRNCGGPVYFFATNNINNKLTGIDRCRQCGREYYKEHYLQVQQMLDDLRKQRSIESPASSSNLPVIEDMFGRVSNMMHQSCYAYLLFLVNMGEFFATYRSSAKHFVDVARRAVAIIPLTIQHVPDPYVPNNLAIPVAAMQNVYGKQSKATIKHYQFWLRTTKALSEKQCLPDELRAAACQVFSAFTRTFADFINYLTGPQFNDMDEFEKADLKKTYAELKEECNF